MSEDTKKRLTGVDFLKTLGLICIVAAHTGPPGWVKMLRNFDVPLMVILSAMLGAESLNRRSRGGNNTWGYLLGRFKRIVFPTWIFLIIYFVLDLLLEGKARPVKYMPLRS